MCVCVREKGKKVSSIKKDRECLCERERENERGRKRETDKNQRELVIIVYHILAEMCELGKLRTLYCQLTPDA